jgi:hypothetical protein
MVGFNQPEIFRRQIISQNQITLFLLKIPIPTYIILETYLSMKTPPKHGGDSLASPASRWHGRGTGGLRHNQRLGTPQSVRFSHVFSDVPLVP